MSAIEYGFYGNEMTFSLAPFNATVDNTHILDVYEADIIVGKNTFTNNDITFTAQEQETNITSRSFQAQITINYRGGNYVPDTLLFSELMSDDNTTIVKPYKFRMSQGGVDYDKNVYVTSINANYRNNSVQQITFQLERV